MHNLHTQSDSPKFTVKYDVDIYSLLYIVFYDEVYLFENLFLISIIRNTST